MWHYLGIGNINWAQWEGHVEKGPRHKKLKSKLVMFTFKEKQKAAKEDTGEANQFLKTS